MEQKNIRKVWISLSRFVFILKARFAYHLMMDLLKYLIVEIYMLKIPWRLRILEDIILNQLHGLLPIVKV